MFIETVHKFFANADVIFLQTSGLLIFGYIGMLWVVKCINYMISLYQKECENQILDIYPVWEDDNPIGEGYRLEKSGGKLFQVTTEIDSRESFFRSYKKLGRSKYSKVIATLQKFVMAFSFGSLATTVISECREYFSALITPSWNTLYIILSHVIHVQFFRSIPYTGNEFVWMCLGMLISGSYYLSMEYFLFRNCETSDIKKNIFQEFIKFVFIILVAILMSRYFMITLISGFDGKQYSLYFSLFVNCCICTIGAACFCIFFIKLSSKNFNSFKKIIKHFPTILLVVYPVDLLLREIFYIDIFNIPLYEYPATGHLIAPFIRTYVVLSESMVALFCIYMFYIALVCVGIKFLLAKASGIKERIKKLFVLMMKIPELLMNGFMYIGKVMQYILEFAFKVVLYIMEFCFNAIHAIKEQFLNDLISYYRNICTFLKWSYRLISKLPEMVYNALAFLCKALLNCFLFIGQLPRVILDLINKLFKRLIREFVQLIIDIKNIMFNLKTYMIKLLSLVFYSLPMMLVSCVKFAFICVKDNIVNLFKVIREFIANVPAMILEFFTCLKKYIETFFIKLPMMLIFCIKSAITFIIEGITEFFGSIWNIVINLPEKICLMFASFFTNLGEIIKSILTGFVNIITSIQKTFLTLINLPKKLFIALCKDGVLGLLKALYFNTVEMLFKMFYSVTHKG